jgi:hypothetical protein
MKEANGHELSGLVPRAQSIPKNFGFGTRSRLITGIDSTGLAWPNDLEISEHA